MNSNGVAYQKRDNSSRFSLLAWSRVELLVLKIILIALFPDML